MMGQAPNGAAIISRAEGARNLRKVRQKPRSLTERACLRVEVPTLNLCDGGC